jgi:hypothetical protein
MLGDLFYYVVEGLQRQQTLKQQDEEIKNKKINYTVQQWF